MCLRCPNSRTLAASIRFISASSTALGGSAAAAAAAAGPELLPGPFSLQQAGNVAHY